MIRIAYVITLSIFCITRLPAAGQVLVANHLPASKERTTTGKQKNAVLLESMLGELEAKYRVSFFYKTELVKGLTVLEEDMPGYKKLEQDLEKLLRRHGLSYRKAGKQVYVITPERAKSEARDPVAPDTAKSGYMLPRIILPETALPENMPAQEPVITGRVTDAGGLPLPGVSVVLKGSDRGASTGLEGNYRFTVPEESLQEGVLVFSFIGYATQEVRLRGRRTIDISLEEDVSALEEIVVVGYGTQRKSVITGAISSVRAGDLENQQVSRLEQALQGRASGLTIVSSSGEPGAAATVRIRGTTSLNDDANNPLYVVDGVVVSNGRIGYLNPSDIESIEVLKDAASAAIYGARSAAGVILITTKKGKSGTLDLNYNGYFGTQAPAKKLDLLNASEYAMLQNEQAVNGGDEPVYENPGAFGEGTDWQDLVFNNNALIQNHEFSISGGSERSTFYSSFGMFNQEGIVATDISHYKRYSIRLNSNHRLKDWLNIGQTFGYSHVKNKGNVPGNTDFGGPLSGAIMLDPITPAIITDPDIAGEAPYSTQAVVRDEQGNPYGISPTVQQQVTNPLAYIQTREGNYNWSDDLVGNFFVEALPLKGLKLRSTLGGRLTYWGSEVFTPIYFLNANQESSQTSFYRDRRKSLNWNLENTISYNHTVGKHDFTVLLGQGAYLSNNSSFLEVTYHNLPVDNFDDASMNYSTAAENIEANGEEGIEHTVSSLFGRITYNYAGKYLFTGVLRRDGSSRFGANNQFGYFPSASLGWVVSEEDFWTAGRAVDFMKIRASYGVTGTDVLGDYRFAATVSGGRNYVFGPDDYLIGYSPDAPANPDLRWEETSQLNFGLDAVLFRNWDLTFDWFNKKTKGILQPLDLPRFVGATGSAYGNVADMDNSGLELELGYHGKVGAVNLDLGANVSYQQNEVVFLGEGKDFLEGEADVQNAAYFINRTTVGHPIRSFYGFQTRGIFQNQVEIDAYTGPDGTPIQPDAQPGDFRWADLNGDGQITEEDRTFIGNPAPDWSYGFTFNAAFKNFDLLVFGQGVAGSEIYQGLRRLDIPTANWERSALNRWTGEGTSDSYPRLTSNDANKNFSYPSDFHLEKGDYFRIKTLQIGYTLPVSLTGKAGLQRVRVYLSSHNLLTIAKYTGYDPEIGGDEDKYGVDRAIYPQARSFLFGLNVGL